MTERRIWWNWQNLTKADGHATFPINGRAWLYVFAWRFHAEWHLWRRSCSVGVELGGDEDSILGHVCFPPVSLWMGVAAPWRSWLRRILPAREHRCEVAIHDCALWVHPWCDDDWRSRDPWWRRGFAFHFDDFLLGRTQFTNVETRPSERIVIDLDGHQYHGTAKFERATWKRPRWFAKVRQDVWISMDPGHGLPHSGKGENSWDCGDDALCGWGIEGDDVSACIRDGIERVTRYRERYGNPSRYEPVSA